MDLYQEDEKESAQAAQTFNAMLNDCPTFEQFEFVASVFGFEYDADKAKAWYAAKEKRRELMAVSAPPATPPGSTDAPDSTDAAQQPDVPEGATENDATAKALKAANTDGVMIALDLPEGAAIFLENAARAAFGEEAQVIPAKEMHITLAYFGDVPSLTASSETLSALVRAFASQHSIIHGSVSGIGRFSHEDDEGKSAFYVSFDSPELPGFQHDLMELLDGAGLSADKTHGFTPHITVAYASSETDLGAIEAPTAMPITFDAVVLAWGGEWTAFPLTANAKSDTASVKAVNALWDDLAKWERAALKRIKHGGDLAFNSDNIPPALHGSILGALETAADAGQVKAIFANAQTWGSYP